jgi:predicted MFS family arabinose efflux permease
LAAQPGSPARLALATLVALALAMGVGRFAFTPLLPLMQAESGLSLTGGSWLAFANYLGYMVGALAAVWLRVPAYAMVRAGLAGTGAFTAAMGLLEGFGAWWLLRFAGGVASAFVLVYGSAYTFERLALERAERWGGVAFSGVGLGIAASGIACALLAALGAGSQAIWVALGAGSLVLAALVWRTFRAEPRRAAAGVRDAPAPLRGWDARIWTLVLAYATFGFGYIIPATFLPVMARDMLGAAFANQLFWPLFGLAASASALAIARLGGSAARRVLAAAYLAQAAGVLAPALWASAASIVLANLLVGGTIVTITMLGLKEARLRAGANAAPLMAAMTAAFGLGQIAGPVFAGYVVEWTGGFAPALWSAALLLAAAGSALAVFHRASARR